MPAIETTMISDKASVTRSRKVSGALSMCAQALLSKPACELALAMLA